jgi:hypothetical protein
MIEKESHGDVEEDIRLTEETDEIDLNQVHVDQITAATSVFEAIRDLSDEGKIGPGLEAVVETDVFRLRRGLCLPCAAAACLNTVTKRRLVGDVDGEVNIGDLYRVIIPFHGKNEFKDPAVPNLEKGWLVVTPQGDMYHAAITAISKALGVPAMPVESFGGVNAFRDVLASGGAVAISMDNTFVLKETLHMRPDLVQVENDETRILIEGPGGMDFRKFEHGRHVIALVGIEGNMAHLIDSFRLPAMKLEETRITVPVDRLDTYFDYFHGGNPRAIVFGGARKQKDELRKFASKVIVPGDVVEAASDYFHKLRFQ